MDFFEFTLLENKINEYTHTSKLKKLISQYYRQANTSCSLHYERDSYSKTASLEIMQDRLYYLALANKAIAKFGEIGGDVQTLPKFTAHSTVTVDVVMTLQEAYDWVKYKQRETQ